MQYLRPSASRSGRLTQLQRSRSAGWWTNPRQSPEEVDLRKFASGCLGCTLGLCYCRSPFYMVEVWLRFRVWFRVRVCYFFNAVSPALPQGRDEEYFRRVEPRCAVHRPWWRHPEVPLFSLGGIKRRLCSIYQIRSTAVNKKMEANSMSSILNLCYHAPEMGGKATKMAKNEVRTEWLILS